MQKRVPKVILEIAMSRLWMEFWLLRKQFWVVMSKEQEEISEILVTDIQQQKLKKVMAWLDDKRFSAKVLDINDNDALVSAIKGYDLVLNTSAVRDKFPALKAALAEVLAAIGKLPPIGFAGPDNMRAGWRSDTPYVTLMGPPADHQ